MCSVDKAFYLFLNHSQLTKSSKSVPGVNAIIALNKLKKGQFTDINPETIKWLIDRQYIKRSQSHSHRYILADEYEQLTKTEQKIGSKYVVREVERVVTALQGKTLKIGDLEERLTGSLNRNQIKYLVNKLFTDKVVTAEGSGRGTRYKLDNRFDEIQGSELIKQVITHLRRIISK